MNLLFPTDFSESSVKAFEYAYYLSKKLNLPVTVLHVYPVPITTAPIDDAGITEISEELILATEKAMDERLNQFKENLKDTYNKHEPGLVRVDTMLRMGFIAEEIVRAAEETESKCILINVHHESNLQRLFAGSATAAILRKSKIPVLTIPDNGLFREIKKIAYATDLSYADNDIINKLLELADQIGAEVKCFHIHNSKMTVENSIIQDFIAQYQNEVDSGMISFQLVENSSTIDGMDYFVKENNIDLLALFKQKHYWIDIFDKSLSKQMAFHADVPLLIYHE